MIIRAIGWIYAPALWHDASDPLFVNVTKSERGDLFCYQLVTDGRGDPAVWPWKARGHTGADVFICLTPSQSGTEFWGWVISPGAVEMIQWAHEKLCLGRGLMRGGFGQSWWRGPQEAETDPLLTLSMRGHPAISSVDTNRLISKLISDSKQQRWLTGAQTVQWLIKGGWHCPPLNAWLQTAACPPSPPCQPYKRHNMAGCLAAISISSRPALLIICHSN